MNELPVIAIVGPTACGKSALAVALAHALNGEVVSADSMQVYRKMDIGTAKITPGEQEGVPHFGIDLLDPEESFDACTFQTYARTKIDEIRDRGRVPILCGGTGFFVHSVLFPMDFSEADKDEAYRESLHAVAEREGCGKVHDMLREVDPVSAERIHPNNLKRVIRALEVYKLTGKPMSSLDKGAFTEKAVPLYDPLVWIGLEMPIEDLEARIARRVELMVKQGLADEVRELWKMGLRPGVHTSMQGIGYRQYVPWLEGETSFEEATERVRIETRQFAKRQMTWFKREKEIEWLDARLGTEALVQRILKEMREKEWTV